MNLQFNPSTDEIVKKAEIEEIEKRILIKKDYISSIIPSYLKFLQEQNLSDYIEIHVPIFDYGITLVISFLKQKLLISILDYKDSKVYGNLLVDGYDCIKSDEVKNFGNWSKWKLNRLSYFRPVKTS